MMLLNMRSALTVIGLAILRFGVPIVGIWLLGAVLKYAIGNHKDSE